MFDQVETKLVDHQAHTRPDVQVFLGSSSTVSLKFQQQFLTCNNWLRLTVCCVHLVTAATCGSTLKPTGLPVRLQKKEAIRRFASLGFRLLPAVVAEPWQAPWRLRLHPRRALALARVVPRPLTTVAGSELHRPLTQGIPPHSRGMRGT